ncbi:hypothetical protein C8Q75DRAFT_495177 [Abortiporus biennis]|nr:hypothetical protein C8Q75DRAFT_495177 [Abortiporus biennis]
MYRRAITTCCITVLHGLIFQAFNLSLRAGGTQLLEETMTALLVFPVPSSDIFFRLTEQHCSKEYAARKLCHWTLTMLELQR